MPPHALLQFWTVPLHPAPNGRMVGVQTRSSSSSSTSRSDSEYRKYQRTAQRIKTGSVCRHLKIAGRFAIFGVPSGYQSAYSARCNTSFDTAFSGSGDIPDFTLHSSFVCCAGVAVLPGFSLICRLKSLILFAFSALKRTLDLRIGVRVPASQPI